MTFPAYIQFGVFLSISIINSWAESRPASCAMRYLKLRFSAIADIPAFDAITSDDASAPTAIGNCLCTTKSAYLRIGDVKWV
jgi:hypothetical protein